MAVTAVDGDCHVVTARDDGSLWHTIVGADGSVLPWEDVWAQAGSLPGRIVSLATAGFPFVHAATPALAAGSTPQYPLPVSDASSRP